jgi:hypothetical protein
MPSRPMRQASRNIASPLPSIAWLSRASSFLVSVFGSVSMLNLRLCLDPSHENGVKAANKIVAALNGRVCFSDAIAQFTRCEFRVRHIVLVAGSLRLTLRPFVLRLGQIALDPVSAEHRHAFGGTGLPGRFVHSDLTSTVPPSGLRPAAVRGQGPLRRDAWRLPPLPERRLRAR